jgi:hypothetical protein
VSTFGERGLTSNQESIYKCLVASEEDQENLYRCEVLIKFEVQDKIIKVYFKGEEMVFVEFFTKVKKRKEKQIMK